MGRTSKFLFPLPGRRGASKEREPGTPKSSSGKSGKSSSGGSNHLSKAQRILGTDSELNIDSPRSDVPSWNVPSSRSSGMSVSVSESTRSTRSTAETESLSGSNADQWEHESAILPRGHTHRLGTKASSTLLGQQYVEDGGTDASSMSRRMRHEGSDSTLKSYYDRQKSPLSISQQTSESSARDLALRKGHPQIARSPLLQVESMDPVDQQYRQPGHYHAEASRDKSSRKKPARLDLTKLFPRSRRQSMVESSDAPPVVRSTDISSKNANGRRKLTKQNSKESIQSQTYSIRSTQSANRNRQTNDTLAQVYDRYEQLSIRSPIMEQIPESRVLDPGLHPRRNGNARPSSSRRPYKGENAHHSPNDQPRSVNSHLSPIDNQGFSWKNIRMNENRLWDNSSATSISSRNTKTSRHTSTSAFSNSDLKQKSVLSLSSESEGESSDAEPPRSTPLGNNYKSPHDLRDDPPQLSDKRYQKAEKMRLPASKHQARKVAIPESPFLSIPESSFPNPRLSGPWSPPDLSAHADRQASAERKERRSSKKAAPFAAPRSLVHPTPPLSPSSTLDSREVDKRGSGRYMVVTKQEEALLEALRQKRARMKENIIKEHEIAKSPPRSSGRKSYRVSEGSSISTIRGSDGSSNKGNIPVYLDTPLSDIRPTRMHTAEPSPDLSDFLSFGSDEDTTPRTSWVPQKQDKRKSDSIARVSDRDSPTASPTGEGALRLSAVGAGGVFRNQRTSTTRSRSSSKKRDNVSVRFLDDASARMVNGQEFLLEENESDVIWGM
ncbi:hypothetical protein B0O99DRAFT_610396 [Bisporella sp. PMI_857]|nr:hypothetical protein B0O99DRAFT_612810 [Bisporella sp. PMI_857]KAH8600305.1 hypothetical protein B0O99DRAFT_610396 [Bisporella sp. PMI_857]